MSYSEEDNSSRESFASSDMEGLTITSDRRKNNEFSRLRQSSFSYEPKISRTKKVSFMIGDDVLEEEMGEDAFHHDYNMSVDDNDSEFVDTIEYPYSPDDSWRDIKFLADQLESQVRNDIIICLHYGFLSQLVNVPSLKHLIIYLIENRYLNCFKQRSKKATQYGRCDAL